MAIADLYSRDEFEGCGEEVGRTQAAQLVGSAAGLTQPRRCLARWKSRGDWAVVAPRDSLGIPCPELRHPLEKMAMCLTLGHVLATTPLGLGHGLARRL